MSKLNKDKDEVVKDGEPGVAALAENFSIARAGLVDCRLQAEVRGYFVHKVS